MYSPTSRILGWSVTLHEGHRASQTGAAVGATSAALSTVMPPLPPHYPGFGIMPPPGPPIGSVIESVATGGSGEPFVKMWV